MIQSKAWRVRYTIHGDDEGYFKIETHRETNDGILTVVKVRSFFYFTPISIPTFPINTFDTKYIKLLLITMIGVKCLWDAI